MRKSQTWVAVAFVVAALGGCSTASPVSIASIIDTPSVTPRSAPGPTTAAAPTTREPTGFGTSREVHVAGAADEVTVTAPKPIKAPKYVPVTGTLYAVTVTIVGISGTYKADPLFFAAACRFDLDDGMVQVAAPGQVPFWSVSVYDRNGHNVYSFNDHSATNGRLDTVVLTPAQMIEVRKELPEDFAGSIFVEAPIREGIVVIRSFVPDESWKPIIRRFLADATCDLETFED